MGRVFARRCEYAKQINTSVGTVIDRPKRRNYNAPNREANEHLRRVRRLSTYRNFWFYQFDMRSITYPAVGTTTGRPPTGTLHSYLRFSLFAAPVILRTVNDRPYGNVDLLRVLTAYIGNASVRRQAPYPTTLFKKNNRP